MKNEEIIKKLDEIKKTLENNDKTSNEIKALKIVNKHIKFGVMRSDNGKYYLQVTIKDVGLLCTEIESKEYFEIYHLTGQVYF